MHQQPCIDSSQYLVNTIFKTEIIKLFDILISSVLNYSSEVWGFQEGKDIEQVHTKFLRKILCVNKSTKLAGLYGELGRVPPSVMRKVYMHTSSFSFVPQRNDKNQLSVLII